MKPTSHTRPETRIAGGLLAALAVAIGTPAGASPPPPAAAAKVEDPGAKRITGSENYVPTFGLRASITRGRDIHGVLTVDAGLDVPSDKMRKFVEGVRPRLMNSMREVVLNYASLTYPIGEKPDADLLALRLQKAVDAVLGKDQAKVALASVIVFPK
jgi:hypothetical protein